MWEQFEALGQWFDDHKRVKQAAFILLILVSTYVASRLAARLIRQTIKKNRPRREEDLTRLNFFRHLLQGLIWAVGVGFAISVIPEFKTVSSSLLAGAGVIVAVIGFASQQAFGNLVSGMFIVIFKPFRVNDFVEVQNEIGYIEDITLRHTVIRNIEYQRIIIPNLEIGKMVIVNHGLVDERILLQYYVQVAYETNLDHALQVLQTTVAGHPNGLDLRTEEELANGTPKVKVLVYELGESGITLRASVWANNNKEAFHLKCDLNKMVKEAFDAGGIEIPYPRRYLVWNPGEQPPAASS